LVAVERLHALSPAVLDRYFFTGFRERLLSYDDDKVAQAHAVHRTPLDVQRTNGISVVPSYVVLPEDQVCYIFSAYYTYREAIKLCCGQAASPPCRLWLSFIRNSNLYS
jgi:hypothetical protein